MTFDALKAKAVLESVVFPDFFTDMPDPRLRGKVDYPLDEIRPLCLTAVLAGAETVAAIARFGWPDPYLPTTPTFIPMAVATHATKQADKNLRNNVATVFVGLKFSR